MKTEENLDNISLPQFSRVRVDIGLSYTAPNSALWLNRFDDLLVVGIEPLPLNRDLVFDGDNKHGNPQLRVSMKDNSVKSGPNIIKKIEASDFILLPFALDDIEQPSKETFYQTKLDPGCSSLHRPVKFDTLTEIEVEVLPAKKVLELIFEKYKTIDFIKIDAQGKDFDIIKNFGDLVCKVGYIYMETTVNGEYDFEEVALEKIQTYMKSKKFKLVSNTVNDALWVNGDMDVSNIEPLYV